MQTLIKLSFGHGNAKGALFITHKSLLLDVDSRTQKVFGRRNVMQA
jgi:hypothetical protein